LEWRFSAGVVILYWKQPQNIFQKLTAYRVRGYLSLNLVIAQGEAFLMAGIRYFISGS